MRQLSRRKALVIPDTDDARAQIIPRGVKAMAQGPISVEGRATALNSIPARSTVMPAVRVCHEDSSSCGRVSGIKNANSKKPHAAVAARLKNAACSPKWSAT